MSGWMTVLDDLLDQIVQETYRADIRLPSENKLAECYGVTRHDVRKAYDRLDDMGYIYSAQGKGRYYKSKQDKIELILSGDISFTEKMEALGYELKTLNVGCVALKKAPKIRKAMGLHDYEGLYKVSRLRIIDGEPAAIHMSYLTDSTFPNIALEGPDIKSIFHYYRSYGLVSYYSKSSELQTALPSKFERDVLNCPSLTPVLILSSQCFDAQTDELLEYSKIVYRGDRFICRFSKD